MIDQFIGKNCEVTVAFSFSATNHGYTSCVYTGLLLSEDDNFIKLNGASKTVEWGIVKDLVFSRYDTPIIISKKYIVSIRVLAD